MTLSECLDGVEYSHLGPAVQREIVRMADRDVQTLPPPLRRLVNELTGKEGEP